MVCDRCIVGDGGVGVVVEGRAGCGRRLAFLLQLYCPVDDSEHTFHRSHVVFLCRNPSCVAEPGSVRVFRCQLSRRNELYPFNPPSDSDIER